MFWNYRIIGNLSNHTKKFHFGIHEVYYTDGKPTLWTVSGVIPSGSSKKEIKKDLKYMNKATSLSKLYVVKRDGVEVLVKKKDLKRKDFV